MRPIGLLTIAVAAIAMATGAEAEDKYIVVQSTTSTQASGLYDYLLPVFEDETGIDVRVVAVGTGQAIKNATNCDGDVLLVHAKAAEMKFIEAGYGTERTDLMYNDFVIVGPAGDPAGIKGMTDAGAALVKLAGSQATFLSRGDDSGTNKAEMRLWSTTDVDPAKASGTWYRETGSGMGATLNAAVGMEGYTLTDRATWINFANKGTFEIMVEGDPDLFNQYGVIPVSPDHCPSARIKLAQTFADWLLSEEGRQVIASYRLNGEQLFYPNAPK